MKARAMRKGKDYVQAANVEADTLELKLDIATRKKTLEGAALYRMQHKVLLADIKYRAIRDIAITKGEVIKLEQNKLQPVALELTHDDDLKLKQLNLRNSFG